MKSREAAEERSGSPQSCGGLVNLIAQVNYDFS